MYGLQNRRSVGLGVDSGWIADLVLERTREKEGEKQAEHQFDKRIS